ncbi:hypothetical protein CEUSTIGMA_g9481.t1 [Chlamydomonas eustigma]|uniref:VWFA domain-containing protein n=1 Tax=Chlamydomonas eustigma TaxID=1157962 RepID=A0A250XG78_9CHLO|nr:hypothetical protein CEUSTIGMA_g9481.t1 [Chlamydomonas eustigma]|eukprot:GAX82053.1 hypothetical protein CEUSTIGMA_g9481.t1 [Chlamydomonas eustigma]
MGTLENSKSYGLAERTQTLQDLSRSRLNGPTPHQAPQRERVSHAQSPPRSRSGSARRQRHRSAGAFGGSSTRRWTDLLSPERNMGVPQLMMILEPNIVWDHVKTYSDALGKKIEASYCPGEFFEGWHKAGRLAHGVYEGSYWELIGDADEMIEMLRKMARAPVLLEEPPLVVPEGPDLPKWEDFKPDLQALPSAPDLPQLRLPPFRAPILDTEVPFVEPLYLALPEIPSAPHEEKPPAFEPPDVLQVEELAEPEYVSPTPPVGSVAPTAPAFGKPEHGHDWSGERPFQIEIPAFQRPKPLDVPRFIHPPRDLPRFPLMEDLKLDRPSLDLDPIPRFELAWECGPDPEPSYSTISTSRTTSRAPSPPRTISRPNSALPSKQTSSITTPAQSRPGSALPSRPNSAVPSRPLSALPTKSDSIVESLKSQSPTSSRPHSAALVQPAPQSAPVSAPAAAPAPGLVPASAVPVQSRPTSAKEARQWSELQDVDAGKPRAWLNFEKPFAELPPIFFPEEPQLGVVNGPEPREEDFPHEPLEDLPKPEDDRGNELLSGLLPIPIWVPPKMDIPKWVPPREPRPIGFLRGTAPILIIDVSGTMNPRINGKFKEMKACVCELLDPTGGELATAAGAFDVIAYCSGAWSWSSTYASRMSLLSASQVFYQGRQAGGKPRPGSSRIADKTRSGSQLQPTEPDLLADAQNWVDKWPDAVGHTSLMAAFQIADEHWAADSWYIFSDGLADDPTICMDFLEARIKHGQQVPVIHTVGFFPEGAPENFEGRRTLQTLSAMTGGTHQEYDRNAHRIYREGVGFVTYDLKTELPADRVEREWAESQLRRERKKNMRLGIKERLEITMARVQAMHAQLRVRGKEAEYEQAISADKKKYEEELAAVLRHNNELAERARLSHEEATRDVVERNNMRIQRARAAFQEAQRQWLKVYQDALDDWKTQNAELATQRSEAIAALNRSRGSSRPTSAVSARPISATNTRAFSSSGRPLSAIRVSTPDSPGRSLAHDVPHSSSNLSRPASGQPNRPLSASYRTPPSSSRPQSASSRSWPVSASRAQAPGSVVPSSLPTHAEDSPSSHPADSPVSNPADSTSQSGSRSRSAFPRPEGNLSLSETNMLKAVPTLSSASVSASGSAAGSRHISSSPAAVPTVPSSPSRAANSSFYDDDDGFIIQEEGGDDVGELFEGPPALQLLAGDDEEEQELRRLIFPQEVVQALDMENATALASIRDEWQKLLQETEARNKKKLEVLEKNKAVVDKYATDVINCYARGFAKDVVMGAALRTAVNDQRLAAAQRAYEIEVDNIKKENARIASLHAAEVEVKMLKEQQYKKALEKWEANKEVLAAKYQEDIARAKKEHMRSILIAEKEWQIRREEMENLNVLRLKEAEARYAKVLDAVKEVNLKHVAAYDDKVMARKAVEAENQNRLAEARAVHRVCLEQLQLENAARLEQAQVDHQALCVRLASDHEDAKVAAQHEFEELRAFLIKHNEGLINEARQRFQEALVQAQADYDDLCREVREQNAIDLQRVRTRNAEIWPQVQIARLATAELGRVQAFAEHIKWCANKYGLGVNFMPNTPNFDRVVEMQALNEALQKAYPDMSSDSYPWPDHDRKGEQGTGWVAAPEAPSLTLPDPSFHIMRLALGKGMPSSGQTAKGSTSPSSSISPPSGVSPARGGARINSAGAGLNVETSGRPLRSGARPASASLTTHLASGMDRPGSANRTRFSNLVPPDSPQHQHRPMSSLARKAAWAGSAGDSSPHTLSPLKGQVNIPSVQRLSLTGKISRPTSATVSRPQSGRYLPARLSAKLGGIQGALTAARDGAAYRAAQAGFTGDLPRLRYTEIDVMAVE